jgi:hypothetical protein
MTCTSCRLGRTWECRHAGRCNDNSLVSNIPIDSDPSDISDSSGPVREIKTYKNDAVLKDQQSTGRKRAAEMYPLDREADCEWKMQKNCGGGKRPIIGCADGKQEARHHGPDKNTLNNDQGNVHRICHKCHNRWHAKNDPDYVWGSVYSSHSPTPCSQEEIIESELSWLGKKLENVVD